MDSGWQEKRKANFDWLGGFAIVMDSLGGRGWGFDEALSMLLFGPVLLFTTWWLAAEIVTVERFLSWKLVFISLYLLYCALGYVLLRNASRSRPSGATPDVFPYLRWGFDFTIALMLYGGLWLASALHSGWWMSNGSMAANHVSCVVYARLIGKRWILLISILAGLLWAFWSFTNWCTDGRRLQRFGYIGSRGKEGEAEREQPIPPLLQSAMTGLWDSPVMALVVMMILFAVLHRWEVARAPDLLRAVGLLHKDEHSTKLVFRNEYLARILWKAAICLFVPLYTRGIWQGYRLWRAERLERGLAWFEMLGLYPLLVACTGGSTSSFIYVFFLGLIPTALGWYILPRVRQPGNSWFPYLRKVPVGFLAPVGLAIALFEAELIYQPPESVNALAVHLLISGTLMLYKVVPYLAIVLVLAALAGLRGRAQEHIRRWTVEKVSVVTNSSPDSEHGLAPLVAELGSLLSDGFSFRCTGVLIASLRRIQGGAQREPEWIGFLSSLQRTRNMRPVTESLEERLDALRSMAECVQVVANEDTGGPSRRFSVSALGLIPSYGADGTVLHANYYYPHERVSGIGGLAEETESLRKALGDEFFDDALSLCVVFVSDPAKDAGARDMLVVVKSSQVGEYNDEAVGQIETVCLLTAGMYRKHEHERSLIARNAVLALANDVGELLTHFFVRRTGMLSEILSNLVSTSALPDGRTAVAESLAEWVHAAWSLNHAVLNGVMDQANEWSFPSRLQAGRFEGMSEAPLYALLALSFERAWIMLLKDANALPYEAMGELRCRRSVTPSASNPSGIGPVDAAEYLRRVLEDQSLKLPENVMLRGPQSRDSVSLAFSLWGLVLEEGWHGALRHWDEQAPRLAIDTLPNRGVTVELTTWTNADTYEKEWKERFGAGSWEKIVWDGRSALEPPAPLANVGRGRYLNHRWLGVLPSADQYFRSGISLVHKRVDNRVQLTTTIQFAIPVVHW